MKQHLGSSNLHLRHKLRTLWELSRFHTRESWFAWYPAIWGLCFATFCNPDLLSAKQIMWLILSNWLCMTMIHGCFCTWKNFTYSDILDAHIDSFAVRTSKRPLPSGSCSPHFALLWFLIQIFQCGFLTKKLLGTSTLVAVIPSCILAFVYPWAKRIVGWPQFVLAASLSGGVIAGWVSLSSIAPHSAFVTVDWRVCTPVAAAYAAWTLYFDTAYGLQDISGDRISGTGSLAQMLGTRWYNPFMIALNLITVIILQIAATRADAGMLVSVGLAAWGASTALQVQMLKPEEPESGGLIFRWNICIGLLWVSVLIIEAIRRTEEWRLRLSV
ncbi:hypothetical protein M501DRAFT_944642 [Patellaria atrata CBS 101060]|uniref:Prenyltransferase n=1 Tax=Patellaria atrata CBS 101060 TaxID=1346257 RepID=A0A9P4S0U5_9PEZI|nr:hypothetical protein M501DRAFT_944642 [Patellaria atrata CBS 101060]